MLVTEFYDGQGLGNQLWCYVTTRVIAQDRGYSFGIMAPQKFKGKDFLHLDFGETVIGGEGPEGGPPTKLPQGIDRYYAERKIIHPLDDSDIRIFDDSLAHVADNTKIDGCMQDEQYIAHRKDEVRKWLTIQKKYDCFDFADDNTCIINFRGSGYVYDHDTFLPKKYWHDAMAHMLTINPKFHFVVITEDVSTAKLFFPELPVFHFSIGKDYGIIKNAHYIILSNSSFAWFPTWLNENLKFCIAPKYWARHNVSDGYWSLGYSITDGWMYLDREGTLSDSSTCKKELASYMAAHQDYYLPTTIKKNFLVVSNHNHDVGWVKDYTTNYLVYDRSDTDNNAKKLDPTKVRRSPNIGYNLYDYFTFIIDHYDNLPDTTLFVKGNIFPRHITKEYFDRVANNEYFTPLEDYHMHKEKWPAGLFSSDGGFSQRNDDQYLKTQSLRYFFSYNDFIRFCFKNPLIPRYIRFAPGANYIVPKANILKLPKQVYENLRTFISYCPLPGEAHIIERALYTLWTAPFTLNRKILAPVDLATLPHNTVKNHSTYLKKHIIALVRLLPHPIASKLFSGKHLFSHITRGANYRFRTLITEAHKQLSEYNSKRNWASPQKIAEHRKTIHIYDIFTFFNELDMLEIRLAILDAYVDYFVLVEATETFSGNKKPLYYEEHKARFKKWEHKIIHYVTTDTPKDALDLRDRITKKNLTPLEKETLQHTLTSDNIAPGAVHWLKEFYQKESIKKALTNLRDDDICFVSDVDEIWNPAVLIDYTKDDIFRLRQTVYSYYLNNRSNEPWAGTLVTKYKNIRTACLNHLRTPRKTPYTYLKNGGWHFTNMGGADQIRKKLESYGHQEYNNPIIKSGIEDKIRTNKDFIGRNFTFKKDERDLPKYLLTNKEKYKTYFL